MDINLCAFCWLLYVGIPYVSLLPKTFHYVIYLMFLGI